MPCTRCSVPRLVKTKNKNQGEDMKRMKTLGMTMAALPLVSSAPALAGIGPVIPRFG